MCGIAGIIGRVGDRNQGALTRMADAMAHRGPDSAGFWAGKPDPDGFGCMFAHRRLSILDLSTAADQPMIDPTTGKVIIFNGEIYNYRELRSELERAGETFCSTGDTAVMLRALSRKGHQAVGKLRGMFAFALWDDAARQLVLARDPLGIKPLYVCANPDPKNHEWSLLFASEVRSILASRLFTTAKLDPAAVASVVWNGWVCGPDTAVRGITSLQPGEVRQYDARGHERHSEIFWETPRDVPGNKPITEPELREVLRECVRLHLASDVPLGVFLSSGIDSSAVANLAQQSSQTPVNTFTLTFEESTFSEGHHARRIAQAIGTQHREIVLTEQHFVANLEKALDSLDQPTFDGINSYYMSRAVREAGLTVALVGTGGDELFGGYTTFRDLPRLHRWGRRSHWMPATPKVAMAQVVARILNGPPSRDMPAQTRWAKLPDMVRVGHDLLSLYQLSYALFLPDTQRLLIDASLDGQLADGLPRTTHDRLRQEIARRTPLSAISVLEQRLFLGERLLRDNDAASMAVSLEQRLPLVDQVLVEHAVRVPDEDRYFPVGRKQMLRRIGLEGLDPQLFDRPKSGFVLPFDTWIRKGLGRAMDEQMRDEKLAAAVGLNGRAVAKLWQAFQVGAPGLYWSRVWALYVLIRWCHRHNVLL